MPVDKDVLAGVMDSHGRILDQYNLKKRTFYEGVSPEVRPLMWKLLLNYYSYQSTSLERQQHDKCKLEEYQNIKASWQAHLATSPELQCHERLIVKDAARTDKHLEYFRQSQTNQLLHDILMSYVEYDKNMGYTQGMNDLLSPILYTLQTEHEAFWCFVEFFNKIKINFEDLTLSLPLSLVTNLCKHIDPPLYSHLETQCGGEDWLFIYRWILLQFKREFPLEVISVLWEFMWSCPLTKYCDVFVVVACLRLYKQQIMLLQSVEDLTAYTSSISGKLDVEPVLCEARTLIHQLKFSSICPVDLKVLIDDNTTSPPPQVGFVRMRQSVSTRRQRISYDSTLKSIFGDDTQPISRPLPPNHVTPPTTGFVPRKLSSLSSQFEDISQQFPSEPISEAGLTFDDLRSEPYLDDL